MRALVRRDCVFAAVVFLGMFAMAARNVTDPDVWWHLRTGEYIAQHGSVPHTDPFSYTRAGWPWVTHEWLSELLIYGLYRAAGWGELIVVFSAILCAAFFLMYLRCGPNTYVAGLAALFGAWATQMLWGVRPQMISLLMTSLWLLILDRSERNPQLLWWTLPLTVLWVNLHAAFALGLALSALVLAGQWMQRAPADSNRPRYLSTAVIVLLIDFLLVPLNPNGWRMYVYPIQTLRSKAMQTYIVEWASPNFHQAAHWPLLLIVLATIAVLVSSRGRVRARDLLLLAASLYAALSSIRMIPLFVLIAGPLVAREFVTREFSGGSQPRRLESSAARVAANTAIVLGMVVFAAIHTSQVIARQPVAEAEHFPSRAVAFLETHSPAGPIFNQYDWGGYLIWKFGGRLPVFIDGRADLYGERFLNDFAATYELRDQWQQTFRRWQIVTVLVPPGSALAQGLRASPDWGVSYEDSQAIVLNATGHNGSHTQLP